MMFHRSRDPSFELSKGNSNINPKKRGSWLLKKLVCGIIDMC